jgi:hypothetical protein
MSNSDLSGTFGSWRDRVTYLIAEAQLLVAGVMVTLGIVLLWVRPEVPGIPAWVGGLAAAALVFGPPLFGFFVWFIRKFRRRNMVAVYHVNAVTEDCEKYLVAPEVWSEKTVEGPNPYPVNGADGWAVREFEYHEDLEELTVRGVWLEEVEDTKLITSRRHMKSVYEKLVESHLALKIMRDSVSELGADLQGRIVNRMMEARERGTMMDKSAVKDVFEEFEDDVSDLGTEDLPTVEDADLPGEIEDAAEEIEADLPDPDAVGRGDGASEAPADD